MQHELEDLLWVRKACSILKEFCQKEEYCDKCPMYKLCNTYMNNGSLIKYSREIDSVIEEQIQKEYPKKEVA